MPNTVLIGSQWGDEGKGKIIDVLTAQADLVVRYQGGSNAGHTVIAEGEKRVLRLVPSGILHEGKTCVIGNGVVMNPLDLIEEIEMLRKTGIECKGRLFISTRAHMVMLYHRALDKADEAARPAGKKIGTTGRGIGPAYAAKVSRSGLRCGDMLLPEFPDLVREQVEETNRRLAALSAAPLDAEEMARTYIDAAARLAPYITDTIPASYLQTHNNAHIVVDLSAAANLTRIQRPWLVTSCEWNDKLIRSAIVWLCQLTGKPILKLTNKDYNENGLSELLALYGSAYNVNIKIFNDLQHADDTYRPERATPYPKRVIVFSPHPDDDVISMGGTIRRLVEQGHDVHVAYETSGNIAVGDEEVVRFLHFINGFNQLFNDNADEVIKNKYAEIRKYLREKKDGDMDTRDILTIKGLIRRGEARTACTYNNIPLDHCHFLDLPFYETGKIKKNPISEADVEIVRNLMREVRPHQIFVAGDLADPHGTHRVCTDAVFAAIDLEKEEGAEWLKDCRIWMYRGAWAEWEIENIEMAVPISPEELRAKRNAILKHQSQMESAPFLGNDERLFWQRSEDRNRGTANLYNKLGLASYEAMEAFVEYIPL